MNEIELKAKELAESVNSQINQARTELAMSLVERGLTPDEYALEDNLLEVIEDLTVPYRCWAVVNTI